MCGGFLRLEHRYCRNDCLSSQFAPPHLQSLNVSSNSFGDDGAGALAAVLPPLTALTSLNLSRTGPFLPAGQGIRAFLASLVHLTLLDELFLVGNSLGDDLCPTLAASLPRLHRLKRLDLGSNAISDAGCIALCSSFRSLHSLTYFSLAPNRVGDLGCSELAATLPTPLHVLVLFSNKIETVGLASLTASLLRRPSA